VFVLARWPGSQGQEAPAQGAGTRSPGHTANEVCISAPFGLPAHTIDAAMGIRKIEVLLTPHSLWWRSNSCNKKESPPISECS
jgi:hypothetical protein